MASGLTGPGRNLGHYVAQEGAPGDAGCHEPPHPMLVPVARALRRRDDAVGLLGEILATLRIPANQEHPISALADRGILGRWRERFEECSGEP